MVALVVCVGEGKGSWAVVSQLVKSNQFDKVYFVMQQFFAEKFSVPANGEKIVIDLNKPLAEIVEFIRSSLDGKLFGDVALNLSSGNGTEHMAVLSALIKVGCGIRFVSASQTGVEEL